MAKGKLVAITTIRYGKDDGSIQEFQPGDSLGSLDEDTERSLEEAGSAVRLGGDRVKAAEPGDDLTVKRDMLLLKANAYNGDRPAALGNVEDVGAEGTTRQQELEAENRKLREQLAQLSAGGGAGAGGSAGASTGGTGTTAVTSGGARTTPSTRS